MTNTIALQLYTVRDETAKNFIGTLRAVAEIGYHGVEFAGYGDLGAKRLSRYSLRIQHENGRQSRWTALVREGYRSRDCLLFGNW